MIGGRTLQQIRLNNVRNIPDVIDLLQRYSQSRWPHGCRPFHDLTGTIPLFHHSNPEAINGGTASGDRSCQQLFWEQPVTKKPTALWIVLLAPSDSRLLDYCLNLASAHFEAFLRDHKLPHPSQNHYSKIQLSPESRDNVVLFVNNKP